MRVALHIRSDGLSRAVVEPLLGTLAPDVLRGGSVAGGYVEDDSDNMSPTADTHAAQAAAVLLADAEQPTGTVVSCRYRFGVSVGVDWVINRLVCVCFVCCPPRDNRYQVHVLRFMELNYLRRLLCFPPPPPCGRVRIQQASSQRRQGVSRVAKTEARCVV